MPSPGMVTDPAGFAALLADVRSCTHCAPHLPAGPRPVLQAHPAARILIAGQAPGRKVHASGIPFDDASGERLRAWLGLTRDQFYDARLVAVVPMGLCYPGRGRSGDLPPRPECAPLWRARLLAGLSGVRLTLLIGSHAMAWHLGLTAASVTDTVSAWQQHAPDVLALPHPSPRNNFWLKRNPWFETELVPHLRTRVAEVLRSG